MGVVPFTIHLETHHFTETHDESLKICISLYDILCFVLALENDYCYNMTALSSLLPHQIQAS